MDLDLRKLRYFVAVARAKHFGQAAEQLYISQPVLSRQIRALEKDLGCALLERSTRSVRLTAAGEQLLEDSPCLLDTASATQRRLRALARGKHRICIGSAPGLSLAEAVAVFRDRQPNVEVDSVRLSWVDQVAAVREGRVDIALLRSPFDGDGLHVSDLKTEPCHALIPRTHVLASERCVTLQQTAGMKLVNRREAITSVEEKLDFIAAGHGIALVPASVAEYYRHPALTAVPVVDGPQYRVSLVTYAGRTQRHIRTFLDIARLDLGSS